MKHVMLLLVLAGWFWSGAARAAGNETAYIPEETPFVAVLNVRPLLRQQVVRQYLRRELSEEQAKQLEAIAEAIALDPEKDVERIVVFGDLGTTSSLTVALEGKFNTSRLMEMAAQSRGYEKISNGGIDIHHIPESNKPYFAILGDEKVIFSDSISLVNESIRAWTTGSSHFEESAEPVVGGNDQLLFWVLADKPDMSEMELPGILGKATYERILITCSLQEEDGWEVQGRFKIAQEEYARQALQGIQGYLAMSQVLLAEGPLKDGLATARVWEIPSETNTVAVSIRLSGKALESLIVPSNEFDRTGQRIYGVTSPTGQTHP